MADGLHAAFVDGFEFPGFDFGQILAEDEDADGLAVGCGHGIDGEAEQPLGLARRAATHLVQAHRGLDEAALGHGVLQHVIVPAKAHVKKIPAGHGPGGQIKGRLGAGVETADAVLAVQADQNGPDGGQKHLNVLGGQGHLAFGPFASGHIAHDLGHAENRAGGVGQGVAHGFEMALRSVRGCLRRPAGDGAPGCQGLGRRTAATQPARGVKSGQTGSRSLEILAGDQPAHGRVNRHHLAVAVKKAQPFVEGGKKGFQKRQVRIGRGTGVWRGLGAGLAHTGAWASQKTRSRPPVGVCACTVRQSSQSAGGSPPGVIRPDSRRRAASRSMSPK